MLLSLISLVIGVPRKTSVRLVSGEAVVAVRFDLPYEELRHGGLKEHWTVSISTLEQQTDARDIENHKTGG